MLLMSNSKIAPNMLYEVISNSAGACEGDEGLCDY